MSEAFVVYCEMSFENYLFPIVKSWHGSIYSIRFPSKLQNPFYFHRFIKIQSIKCKFKCILGVTSSCNMGKAHATG